MPVPSERRKFLTGEVHKRNHNYLPYREFLIDDHTENSSELQLRFRKRNKTPEMSETLFVFQGLNPRMLCLKQFRG